MVIALGLQISLVGAFDPSVGFFGLPALKRLGQDRHDLGRLEVADDHQLAVVGPEIVLIEGLDLVERGLLEAIHVFINGRHVTDVVAGVRRKQALDLVDTQALGSERPCSRPAIRSFFMTSKSLAGKVGSRRIWRRISRTAARLARLVWTEKLRLPKGRRRLRLLAAPRPMPPPLPSRAKFLSRAS